MKEKRTTQRRMEENKNEDGRREERGKRNKNQ